MKIALVKKRYSLRHGGSERYCVVLARRLRQHGHDVAVIGERIDEELAGEVEFHKVPVNRLTSWTRNRSFAENAGRVAKAERFDLVYGLGRSFGLDAVRVTERLQSHWVNVYYRQPANRWLQKLNPRHRTLIDLERTIYRDDQTRRVVTQSWLDRKLVQEYYQIPEEKIRTIHNGVDITAFHPGVREEANTIREEFGLSAEEPLLVFASMDFEGKGLRSILKALKETHHRDCRLIVLGTGPERRFRRIAEELGVGSRVIFAGRRSDISRFYGAGDLFLLPTAYEPFPNVVLEAMACGLPVMTTTTSGGADILEPGKNGYLISEVHAVGEMVECLNQHFDSSASTREDMARHCWATAQEMTIEKNIEKTLELFEEVLSEKFRV
ncbi:MAG: glycosyltransferase family 4 protein [Planctomycetaceae bacterium]|nr:glycosyltransferase family 4 protein [Planctomycetaceae bacterium]